MNKKPLLKGAGVLLLTAILLLSAGAVTANTTKLTTSHNANTQPKGYQNNRDVIWDNGAYTTNALSSQLDTVYPFNSQVADDFQLSSSQSITEVIFTGLFWNGNAENPIDLNVIFYADDGTGNEPTGAGMADPSSTALLLETHSGVTGTDNGDGTYTYDIVLNTAFAANANTKYWFVAQWVGTFPPQWGFCVSASQQLHSCDQGFPLLGTQYWTPMTAYGDVSFQLIGGAPHDTTPPVTTINLTGTMAGGVYITPVTATLTATDDMSGVNYTMYMIDAGAWTTYTAPFVISTQGAHTISYYSVDKAGNIETTKTTTFTIQYPIQITIKGGFGITATIKNNGTAAMTNISWQISLSGGLILVGKTKTGTIATLAAGASSKAKDMVFGFGKTTITVTAGGQTQTATGTVLLFFVVGVK